MFYDIGANYGFYTALASDIATDGQVHAFEPGALCSAYLERNFAGNRNVILNKVAVTNSVGHIAFYDASASGGSVASSVFRALPSRGQLSHTRKSMCVPRRSMRTLGRTPAQRS